MVDIAGLVPFSMLSARRGFKRIELENRLCNVHYEPQRKNGLLEGYAAFIKDHNGFVIASAFGRNRGIAFDNVYSLWVLKRRK